MPLAWAVSTLGVRLRQTGQQIIVSLRRDWPGLFLAVLALLGYHVYASGDAGGCDAWSYFAQGRLLRGLDVGLGGSIDPKAFPALAPLCAEVAGRNIVPGMPPGFSFLLALGGSLGLEIWVSPLIGGLSVWLIYLTSRDLAGRAAASGIAVLWATSPIVIWGATQLMSDLSAATAMLLAHVLLSRKRAGAAGFVIGASVGIRPTNVLFAASLFKRGLTWREGTLWALGVAAAVAYWFVFGLGRYGLDMFAMYRALNTHGVTFEQLGHQSRFIATYTVVLFPVLTLLAVVAVVRRPRETLPLTLWFVAVVLFYSGWRWPYGVWWWTRHVLPAFPALTLLAAHAVPVVRASRLSARPRSLAGVGLLAVLASGGANLVFGAKQGLFLHAFDHVYEEGSREVKRAVRANALVGSINFSGALRLYADVESFNWLNPGTQELMDHGLKSGRRVYLLLDPNEYAQDGLMASLRKQYALSPRASLAWGGYVLYGVSPNPGTSLYAELAPPAPRVAVEAAHGVRGSLEAVVDGLTPPEGSGWSVAGTVVLDGPDSWLLFATDLALVQEVSVTADGNDVYRLQASNDGTTFEPIGDIPFTNEFGLRTRKVALAKPRSMRYLRLVPVSGDGSFSVAEVKPTFGAWAPSVVSATGARGDAHEVADGHALADGTGWNAPGAVVLDNAASRLVLDVPAVPIDAVRIVADGNDGYTLEGSCDGQRWTQIGAFPPVLLSGQQPHLVGIGPDDGWCQFRIGPFGGDGSYAVSEVSVISTQGVVLDLGSSLARASLGAGWVTPATRSPVPFLFAERPKAVLTPRLEHGHGYHLAISIAQAPGLAHQKLEVWFNGGRLGSVDLKPEPAIVGFEIIGEHVVELNVLELLFSDGVTLEGRVSPADRTKPLAAAVQRVAFVP